jgi:hypothetical protein
MTSSTTQPASGTGGRHAEGQGYGLVLFASVLLVIIGCFNLIYGIAAVANSHVFTANAHYVFGGLRTWGWITLIIGVLQLLIPHEGLLSCSPVPGGSLVGSRPVGDPHFWFVCSQRLKRDPGGGFVGAERRRGSRATHDFTLELLS